MVWSKTMRSLMIVAGLNAAQTGISGGEEPRGTRQANATDRGRSEVPPGIPDRPHTVRLTKEAMGSLGVKIEVARAASHPSALVAPGSLETDQLGMARVRSRFPGQVVEFGTKDAAEGKRRPLRSGDMVEEGQTLAVVYSSDLSEEKNDLLDLLSKLRLERESFARVETLQREKAIAEREFHEAQRSLEDAEVDAARVQRSLRAREVSEEEIKRVEDEAKVLHDKGMRSAFQPEQSWGRFSVRSPITGTVIESRFTEREVVGTDDVMFVVANLSRLVAPVRIDEINLPAIDSLPKPIRWTLRPLGWPKDASIEGSVETIGALIDPDDHTATLSGLIPNRNGRLRPGQSITATIALPADPDLIELPLSARLPGDGGRDLIFAQPEADEPVFRLRPVRSVRASTDYLVTRGEAIDGVRIGERVVVAGAASLKAILDGAVPLVSPVR